jgi:hypothetical protein
VKSCSACLRWTETDQAPGGYRKCSLFGELTLGCLGDECKAFLHRDQEHVEVVVVADFWRKPDGSVGYVAEVARGNGCDLAHDAVIRAMVLVPMVEVEGFAG